MMRTTGFAIVLLAATTAPAQSNYASLSWAVYDQQQQVVAGCTLQLSSVSTNSSRQATTTELGPFQISVLLPGNYVLSVKAPGFAPITQEVTLEVGQARTIDFTLKVAPVDASVVDVRSDSANLLRTTDASIGEVVEPTAVPEPHQSRHAESLREYSPVRHNHRSRTPGREIQLGVGVSF